MSAGTQSRTVKLGEGEGQWAIVARMFRKRRTAVWGLRGAFVLVLVAVYAPVISSGLPLLWQAPGGSLESPWLRRLFDANYWTNAVDRFYNVLMVAFTLYAVLALLTRVLVRGSAKRRALLRRRLRQGLLWAGGLLLVAQVWPGHWIPHFLHPLVHITSGAAWAATADQILSWWACLAALAGLATLALAVYASAHPARGARLQRGLWRNVLLYGGLTSLLHVLSVVPLSTSEPYVDYRAEARAHAEAGRDHTAVFPPIPYGHREQLEGSEDRYRGLFSFPEGEAHLLGTDNVGRDVFARLLYGTRISLSVGLVAVAIYVTIGTIIGAIAGYAGGRVDMLVMRTIEIIICVPGLFLILTIIALFGKRSIFMIMFAIGIVGWTGIARLVRGEILRERAKDYVSAAKSLGLGHVRILFRHILPNAIAPVIVAATFGVAGSIITESTLSFLGLGDRDVPSWGMVLNTGRVDQEWHMILCPGVAIFVTVTLLNLVGDGLRDALDPKLRN